MCSNKLYQEVGYNNRVDYLRGLSSDYDVDEVIVFGLADLLGPEEDFDGLINALDDYNMESDETFEGYE